MLPLGHDARVAVGAKHKLTVGRRAASQVVDTGLLTQAAEPAEEIPAVEAVEAVADKGRFKTGDIEGCGSAGIAPCVPRPQRGPSAGRACSAGTSL